MSPFSPEKARDRGRTQRVREALDRFEEAVGGRDSLIEAFLAAPPDDARDALLGLVADPRNNATGLGVLAEECAITPGEVLKFYRDATLARSRVLALHEVAAAAPAVTRDVMRRAQNHFTLCESCRGSGQVWKDLKDGEGKKIDRIKAPCEGCDGTGELLTDASLDHQKLALDLAGLLSAKGPTIVTNVDASTSQMVIGALPFAQLQKAVQKVLDPPQLPQLAPAPAPSMLPSPSSLPQDAVLVEAADDAQ